MPFGGPQLWPLLGLLKQLKSPDKSRTFSPAPGFSRIFTNIFQIFSASEDQTHPAAEGHLDHLEPGGIHGPAEQCWTCCWCWVLSTKPAAKKETLLHRHGPEDQPEIEGSSHDDLMKNTWRILSYYGCSEWLQTLLIHVTIEILE